MAPPSPPSAPARVASRPRRAGLVLATIALGATLSACGSDPAATTCGEVADMSADERVALLEDVVASQDDDAAEKAFAEAGDEERQTAAAGLLTACEAADDDTEVNDLDGAGE